MPTIWSGWSTFSSPVTARTPPCIRPGVHRAGPGACQWQQIFAAEPDLRARVIRSVVAGDAVWTE